MQPRDNLPILNNILLRTDGNRLLVAAMSYEQVRRSLSVPRLRHQALLLFRSFDY